MDNKISDLSNTKNTLSKTKKKSLVLFKKISEFTDGNIDSIKLNLRKLYWHSSRINEDNVEEKITKLVELSSGDKNTIVRNIVKIRWKIKKLDKLVNGRKRKREATTKRKNPVSKCKRLKNEKKQSRVMIKYKQKYFS